MYCILVKYSFQRKIANRNVLNDCKISRGIKVFKTGRDFSETETKDQSKNSSISLKALNTKHTTQKKMNDPT